MTWGAYFASFGSKQILRTMEKGRGQKRNVHPAGREAHGLAQRMELPEDYEYRIIRGERERGRMIDARGKKTTEECCKKKCIVCKEVMENIPDETLQCLSQNAQYKPSPPIRPCLTSKNKKVFHERENATVKSDIPTKSFERTVP